MISEERHSEFITTDALPNDEIGDTVVNEQSRAEFLLTLAMQLVPTLEQTPANSGSKSIHYMLYVSAAAGLRYDTFAVPQSDLHVPGAPREVASLSSVCGLKPPATIKLQDYFVSTTGLRGHHEDITDVADNIVGDEHHKVNYNLAT